MNQNVTSTRILRVEDGASCEKGDLVAVEEPLEISIDGRNISITMRTPGNDEELATGFLFSEGILRDRSQVSNVSITDDNRVNVSIAGSAGLDLGRLDRHFYTSSSCGVCGKTSIQALETVGCPVILRDRPVLAGVYCEWRYSRNAETAKPLPMKYVGLWIFLADTYYPIMGR